MLGLTWSTCSSFPIGNQLETRRFQQQKSLSSSQKIKPSIWDVFNASFIKKWMKYSIVDDYFKHLWQTWVTLNDLQQVVDLILMQISHVMSKVSNTLKVSNTDKNYVSVSQDIIWVWHRNWFLSVNFRRKWKHFMKCYFLNYTDVTRACMVLAGLWFHLSAII